MRTLWDVTVQLPASQGGRKLKTTVEADEAPLAIVQAALVLEEQGFKRWTLVGDPVKVTS